MSAPLEGLVAIVTGGASGLGAAIAHRLREDGAAVAIFDVNPDAATDVDLAVAVDVTDDASVVAGVEQVVEKFGRLDILVNNAGIGAQGDVTANSDDEWHRVFDINVVGIARVSRAAIPYLRQSPVGRHLQHLLHRGDGRPPAAGALQRDQGRCALADAGDGRRSPA